MRRALVAALLGATLVSAAAADSVFDHPATEARLDDDLRMVTTVLRSARTLRGRYVQTRTLREIPRPLVAEGTFVFARDAGIVWRTTAPFASDLVITRDAIVQRDAGGTTRLAASQQPGVRAVAAVFFAVFELDFPKLAEQFVLSSRRAGGGWELGLKPRTAGATLESIVVSGRTHVERVVLRDAGGDATEIRLRDPVASVQPPTPEEQQLLDAGGG